MKVSLTGSEGLERRLTIEIPADRIASEVESRLKKAAQRARIDGFRPGKAPLAVVRQRYAAGVRQEVLGELINKTYGEALAEQKINPAGEPRIEPETSAEQMVEGGDFIYRAVVETYPEVVIGDLSKLKIERAEAEVVEADVDDMINSLREQNAVFVDADRAAGNGDQLLIDFLGKIDGVAFDGGAAERQTVQIGSGRMIPGFEEALIGLSVGAETTISVKFPDDYGAEQLKGNAAEFDIRVHEVKAKELPELDAEFISRFGLESGSLEAFRAEILENMCRELESSISANLKSAVMAALADSHQFDLPKAIVGQEVKRLKQEFVQQYGGGQSFDPAQLPDDMFTEKAATRVKLGLLVSELVKDMNLVVDPDAVNAEIKRIAATYEQSEAVEKYYLQNRELLQGIQMKVLEDQVVAAVAEKAKVTVAKKSYKDVMAARAQ